MTKGISESIDHPEQPDMGYRPINPKGYVLSKQLDYKNPKDIEQFNAEVDAMKDGKVDFMTNFNNISQTVEIWVKKNV